MDPWDIFRGFFGVNRGIPPNRRHDGDSRDDQQRHDFGFDEQNREDVPHVDIFTNPLEMHKFFEAQVEDLLRKFGTGSAFGVFPSLPHQRDRAVEEEDDGVSAGSRDFMLRDDDVKAKDRTWDSDLDEAVASGKVSISSLFPHPEEKRRDDLVPFRSPMDTLPEFGFNFGKELFGANPGGSSNFSFSSVTQRTVRLNDGSVEQHSTRRSNDGSETTTITKSVGDKTHTVTTVRRPDGTTENTETTSEGLADGSPSSFLGSWGLPRSDEEARSSARSARDFMLRESQTTQSLFDRFFGSR